MDTRVLPDAIEPTYWNVVFHPSVTGLNRLLLGRFQHVSAFTYIPGVGAWILYDCQWGGTRIAFLPRLNVLIAYTRGCAVVKFDRIYKPTLLAGRLGFYCVSAVKQLLGVRCQSILPDGLYRYLIRNGGTEISRVCSEPKIAESTIPV
jgi:hypothetical protein